MPDPDDAADRSNFPDPSDWTIDPQAPENDGRVVWLIREIGGPRALAHRCEDIRRRRWGRATTGVGRPLVQPSEFADVETDPDEGGLRQADAVNIWRGVGGSGTIPTLPAGRAAQGSNQGCADCKAPHEHSRPDRDVWTSLNSNGGNIGIPLDVSLRGG